jgi:Flp pilus assembly pilin Flp
MQMSNILRRYVRIREQKGQSMAEYALIMAAIAVVAMVAYTALGGNVSTLVTNVSGAL